MNRELLYVISTVQSMRKPIQYERLYRGQVIGHAVSRSGRGYYKVQPSENIEGVQGHLQLMENSTVSFAPEESVPMISGKPTWPGVAYTAAPLEKDEEVLFTLVPNKHQDAPSRWFIGLGGSVESYRNASAFYAVNPQAPLALQEMAGFRVVQLEVYSQAKWKSPLEWKDYDFLSRCGLVNRLIARGAFLPPGCTIKSWWEDDSKPLGARLYPGKDFSNIFYSAKLLREQTEERSLTRLTFGLLEYQVLTEDSWVPSAQVCA